MELKIIEWHNNIPKSTKIKAGCILSIQYHGSKTTKLEYSKAQPTLMHFPEVSEAVVGYLKTEMSSF